MLMAFLATKIGKFSAIGLGIALLLAAVFLLGKCDNDDDQIKAQVEQTNRSGEAISAAAEMAIDKLEDRTVTDSAVNAAVDQVKQEIGNAQSADAIRDAVVGGLCGQAEHRSDPACVVRQAAPR